MENTVFEVSRIEGEYAYIKNTNDANAEEIFIALALLPFGVDIGTKLLFSDLEYTVLD